MLQTYLHEIQSKLSLGDETEHTHRPAFQHLMEAFAPNLTIINEPKRIAVGAPDFTIRRKLGKTENLAIGYVETKDIGIDLNEVEKSDQLKRYLKLESVLLTDYLEFRWYVNGKLRLSASLGSVHKSKIKTDSAAQASVATLLAGFLDHQPLPISHPQELAQKMAGLCRQIDRIIVQSFQDDKASELLRGLKDALEKTLLPKLTPEQFADMFAQTLAYGLFAACVNHFREKQGEPFRRSEAAKEIPKTNPFLRKLFETINGTDIEDELYIGFVDDLTEVMYFADIASILQYFGKRTGQEDPVVHFYETFLAAYDPKLRETRGVYYTPEPVVSYLVRSVDILLKEKFGLKDGLADRSTIEIEVMEGNKRVKRQIPRVIILDPACGTGTFLYAVVNHIRQKFMDEGNASEWSDFVREHLLKRIYGFELLMAPYAVAHLKLAMQLSGMDLDEQQRKLWAYDFRTDERLNIYLTNSLEMTEHYVQTALFGLEKQIAEEANAARRLKTELPILVVLGNPPYSGHSANKNDWIETRLREAYFMVDGEPLGEKNPKWLQDDYVKFIRFGQWRIEQTGYGILAYITNHGYLDNPTFRGMRQNLMQTFDELYLLDLHGNSKKKETAPDGGKDENVFDIQQGVSIGLFLKEQRKARTTTIRKADLFGKRLDEGRGKYAWLYSHDLKNTDWSTLNPASPFYLFTERDETLAAEYEKGWRINDAMPLNSAGIVTARDDLTIGWTAEEIEQRVQEFVSLPVEEARERFQLGEDVEDWKVEWALEDIAINNSIPDCTMPILYRPFDIRFTYYTGHSRGFICRPRYEVMQHMLLIPKNYGLISARSNKSTNMDHFFVSGYITEAKTGESTTQSCLFPLYIKEEDGSKSWDHQPRTIPNFDRTFYDTFYMRFPPIRRGKGKHVLETEHVSGESVFNYIYAILHSPTYRSRYAEFLKIDFPRIPITSKVDQYRTLAKLGGKLVKLHLLEDDKLDSSFVKYPVKGDHLVEKVRYVDMQQRVYINQEQFFEGVPNNVWEFHIGGYQVCEKWLKDRKGRALTSEDREHYRKIVASLQETINLMAQIDAAIPQWPIE